MSSSSKGKKSDASAVLATCRKRWAGGSKVFNGPSEALLAYAGAFAAQDLDFIDDSVTKSSLVEIPMLVPNRLHGHAEIKAGHAQSFNSITSASFELSEPLEANGVAIAEGILKVERQNAKSETHSLGIVTEVEDGKIRRLSLYFDARHLRPWSDKTIL